MQSKNFPSSINRDKMIFQKINLEHFSIEHNAKQQIAFGMVTDILSQLYISNIYITENCVEEYNLNET